MNDNIKYTILDITDENILLLEKLRYDAYNIKIYDLNFDTLYKRNLKNNKNLVFGCYVNSVLVGACYVSKTFNTLFIEQLFIKKDMQNNINHLGTNLLKYVLSNKEYIENFFNTKFHYSYLDNYKGTANFYKSIGYVEKDNYMRIKL